MIIKIRREKSMINWINWEEGKLIGCIVIYVGGAAQLVCLHGRLDGLSLDTWLSVVRLHA